MMKIKKKFKFKDFFSEKRNMDHVNESVNENGSEDLREPSVLHLL